MNGSAVRCPVLIIAHRVLTTFAIVVVIFSTIRSHKQGDGWKGQLV